MIPSAESVEGAKARISLPEPDEMSLDQQRVYEAVVSGPRGQMIGPLRAAMHSPELAEKWSALGEFLRFRTVLPKRLTELAILVTGRRWSAQLEWWVHAKAAASAGLSEFVINAIREGTAPVFVEADEHVVYEFARQLQMSARTDVDCYKRIESRWGARGVVELTALIGYYTMVAMTLNAHEIPLPDGGEALLSQPAEGLFALPGSQTLFNGQG